LNERNIDNDGVMNYEMFQKLIYKFAEDTYDIS